MSEGLYYIYIGINIYWGYRGEEKVSRQWECVCGGSDKNEKVEDGGEEECSRKR